jgi:methyltransferase (TIGR00027 family)
MEPSTPLDHLGRTALAVAAMRARETIEPEPLFRDPLAQVFLDSVPGERPDRDAVDAPSPAVQALAFGALVRTRFFDDYLISATQRGGRQVALLAAGLDSRAFRLSWPDGVRLFEIDRPGVLAFKDQALRGHPARPHCARQTVAADLTGDWPGALREAGFDRSEPTTWLAEGVLAYLTAEQAGGLLTAIGEQSAPGSRLAFEDHGVGDGRVATEGAAIPEVARIAALWKGGLGTGTVDWLGRNGWRVTVEPMPDVAESYGREYPGLTGTLITAVRP